MSVPSATLRSMMNCEMTPLGPAGSDHWISIMAGVRTSSCGAAMPSGTGDGGKFVPQTASMQYKYYMYVCSYNNYFVHCFKTMYLFYCNVFMFYNGYFILLLFYKYLF